MQHACTRAACSCTWRARRLHVLKENLRLYDSRSTIFTKTSNVSRISNVSRTPLFAIAFFCKKPRLIIGEIRYTYYSTCGLYCFVPCGLISTAQRNWAGPDRNQYRHTYYTKGFQYGLYCTSICCTVPMW